MCSQRKQARVLPLGSEPAPCPAAAMRPSPAIAAAAKNRERERERGREDAARRRPPSHAPSPSPVYELAASLPAFGVGARLARSGWRGDDCFWTLTRVKPSPAAPGRGTAWGVLTWRGEAAPRPARVPGGLKRAWRRAGGEEEKGWASPPPA